MMKKIVLLYCILCVWACSGEQKKLYQDPSVSVDRRVDDLLKRMTLEEKVAELCLLPYYENKDSSLREMVRQGKVGAFLKANGAVLNRSLQEEAMKYSRLGIPLMFHEDVIHGYRTITPIPLAESCSWDPDMVERSSAMAATEAAAAGIQLTYAPMVDVSTDPRWGRIMETSGEDAFLGGEMAKARVRGFQGMDLKANNTIMACVKHFAGYAALLGGRDYQNTDFSLRDLQEIYLKPFQAAIDAGVGSVMCSYTSYNGVPLTMNRFMNHDILRQQMGFKGLLMTDWNTFNHALTEGAAIDGKDAVTRGVKSGMEMDMSSGQINRHLVQLVKDRVISEKLVDEAAAHALKVKFQVGLFDDPYRYFDADREQKVLLSEESKAIAWEMATKSMVLLKNEAEVLPLAKGKRIALVGPFATNRNDLLGSWSMMGRAEEVVNVQEGMSEIWPEEGVMTLGCRLDGVSEKYIRSAVALARQADIIVACIGETSYQIGEGVTTAKIELPQEQVELLKQLRNTGKQVVTVLFNGRPLVLNEVLEHSDALLEAWYPGTMGGKAVASVLCGEVNPSGKLTQTFPRHSGQVPITYNFRRTFYYVHHTDIPEGPQFPFGFGLSYSKYEYSDLKAEKDSLKLEEPVIVTLKIKNVGKRTGREVVQLYVRDEVASIIPRERELKGFQMVELAAGEEKVVRFELSPAAFMLLDAQMQEVLEPGVFRIMVGPNSADTQSVKVVYIAE